MSSVKKEFIQFTHVEDAKGELDVAKAKASCRHCLGTGVVGRMHLTGVRLVCCCVVKADYELKEFLKKEEEKKQAQEAAPAT